jgi:hypothetical protein
MQARGPATGKGPAPQLQCPGLESYYCGLDAPTANCSICFQKKRLHVTSTDQAPAALAAPDLIEANALLKKVSTPHIECRLCRVANAEVLSSFC